MTLPISSLPDTGAAKDSTLGVRSMSALCQKQTSALLFATFTSGGTSRSDVRGSSYNNGAANWRVKRLLISASHSSWRWSGFCHCRSQLCPAFAACQAPPQRIQARPQAAHSHRFRDAATKNRRRGQPALPKFHRGSKLSPRSSRTSSALSGLSPRGVRCRGRRRLKSTAILDRHQAAH